MYHCSINALNIEPTTFGLLYRCITPNSKSFLFLTLHILQSEAQTEENRDGRELQHFVVDSVFNNRIVFQ